MRLNGDMAVPEEGYRPRRALAPEPVPDAEPQEPSRRERPRLTLPATLTVVEDVAPRCGPIEFSRLSKDFGKVRAVDDVTFTVRPGRVTGFLGPNGAGKTTTLRMLAGLVQPTSGSATFAGRRYVDLEQPQRVAGFALEANFHPGRTGRDHLRVYAPTAGADDSRVDELLELVQLAPAARRKTGGYSLGMRQRLALATALLGDPDYLVLDEPANGLDPEGIRWLRSFLVDYARTGRVVLVSSHMLGEVQATADDVVVIGRGRLLKAAPIGELGAMAASSILRVADQQAALAALAAAGLDAVPAVDDRGDLVRVNTADTYLIGEAMLDAGLVITELGADRRSLEETFFAMLEQQANEQGSSA